MFTRRGERTAHSPALFLAVSVLAFALPPLSAQQSLPAVPSSLPVASDPLAVALIQRSLLALTGGVPVSDVTLTGTARRIAGSDDETGTATLKGVNRFADLRTIARSSTRERASLRRLTGPRFGG